MTKTLHSLGRTAVGIVKRKHRILLGLAVGCASGLLCLWFWQANYASTVMVIHVPQWIKGGGDVHYHVVIGKDQIAPYGTVWKQTAGPAGMDFHLVPLTLSKDQKKRLEHNEARVKAWANRPRHWPE